MTWPIEPKNQSDSGAITLPLQQYSHLIYNVDFAKSKKVPEKFRLLATIEGVSNK